MGFILVCILAYLVWPSCTILAFLYVRVKSGYTPYKSRKISANLITLRGGAKWVWCGQDLVPDQDIQISGLNKYSFFLYPHKREGGGGRYIGVSLSVCWNRFQRISSNQWMDFQYVKLVQMYTMMRRCVAFNTRVPTSKVKVTVRGQRSKWAWYFVSGLYLLNQWMDFNIIWYNCISWWYLRPRSRSQFGQKRHEISFSAYISSSCVKALVGV